MTSTMMVAGRYSLDREIGRGGSGAVYLGHDEVLGRVVAVKRVGAPPGGAATDLDRAEREAQLAARVNHPHVVGVYDLVEDGDQQWLVMEYVDGTNLAERIRDGGPLEPDEVARLLAQVADALAAAHDAGIVHRDVKPSNILVAPGGSVKLSDFGIARAKADAVLTQTGLVTGSPAYLSPEVASGQLASAPSDVWSLGATAYHALAGQPPYDVGENLMGALYRIVHEEPPRLRTAGWLAPLLEVMMSKDPAQRPNMRDVGDYLRARPGTVPTPSAAGDPGTTQQMRAVAEDDVVPLAAAPSTPTTSEREQEARSRRRVVPFLVGAVVVALLLVLGVFLLWPDPQQEPTTGPPAASPSGAPSSPDEPSDSQTSEAPTAKDLEDFGTSYVQTAADDPAAGFALLTPTYQEASGGLSGYRSFWGGVDSAEINEVSADVDSMTVSYNYTYVIDGQSTTQDVQLALVRDGDSFLIDGAA